MKKYLLAGLLVWTPLAITIWVLSWLLGLMDGVFDTVLSTTQAVLPPSARSGIEQLRHVPGLGVVALLAGLMLTGVLVANIFGQWVVRQWDRLLNNIPIVKSVYSSVKQVSDTLFSSSGNAFREAVLVQYPRPGSWTIAFVTGKPGGRGGAAPGRRVPECVCAHHAQPHFGLLPDDAARRCGGTADERGRGAEVHHFHGRGRPAGRAGQRPAAAGTAGAKSGGLSALARAQP